MPYPMNDRSFHEFMGTGDEVRAAMGDIELLMSSAWARLTEAEQLMGQRVLDRLRPHATQPPPNARGDR